VARLRALISDFAALLAMPADAAATTRIERVPVIGRPLGRPEWIAMLERRLGLPFGTLQTRPKTASGAGHRATSAAAVRRRVSCHGIPPSDAASGIVVSTDSARGRVRTKSCDDGATAQWHRARSGGC